MRQRILTALLFIIIPLSAVAFPKPTGFVNDFAGVIDAGTKAKLEALLASFERQSGAEVAVATLPSLEGLPIEEVAVDLFAEWGIGKQGKDDGVLFLVAPNDRQMRIEVGYGLEGAINDALAGRILDQAVVPRFRAGAISDGIAAGTLTIVATIAEKEGIAFDPQQAAKEVAPGLLREPQEKKGGPLRTVGKVLLLIVLGYLFIRHPWLFLFVLAGMGGRGGGGRGFSGGFGGFGGGLSGGGGASRGW